MNEILCRFPHVFGAINSNLNDKDLANFRFVSKTWKNSIDNDKCLHQRIINKLVNVKEADKESGNIRDEEKAKYWAETNAALAGVKDKNWTSFLTKAPIDVLKEITNGLLRNGFVENKKNE